MSPPVGILGGTFDPIHHGHLRLALECCTRAGLAEVLLVPAHLPPHRAPPATSPAQRLRMLELAIAGLPQLVADDRELRRGGTSYTVDTLRSLRTAAGDRPLCLITGMDAFRLLHTWREWRSLPDLAHIIVADRAGADPHFESAELAELHAQRAVRDAALLRGKPAGCILTLRIPMLDISASAIRSAIAAGENVRFLLPPAVLDFIESEKLYRAAP